jgi:hypothetical protein
LAYVIRGNAIPQPNQAYRPNNSSWIQGG